MNGWKIRRYRFVSNNEQKWFKFDNLNQFSIQCQSGQYDYKLVFGYKLVFVIKVLFVIIKKLLLYFQYSTMIIFYFYLYYIIPTKIK